MVCICVYANVYIQCTRVQKAREGLWITLEYCVDNSAEGVKFVWITMKELWIKMKELWITW